MKHNREDYLLTVWELTESFDKATEKSVADRLGVSLPSAWEGLHRLEEDGLLRIGRSGISFFPRGYMEALRVMRSHRITEAFVYSYLDVPWDESHVSVMELEHDFSDRMLSSLYKNIGYPESCPHGNPIIPNRKIKEIRASEVAGGTFQIIRQVYEERSLLKKLFGSGLTPGRIVKIEKTEGICYLLGENGEMKLSKGLEGTMRLKMG